MLMTWLAVVGAAVPPDWTVVLVVVPALWPVLAAGVAGVAVVVTAPCAAPWIVAALAAAAFVPPLMNVSEMATALRASCADLTVPERTTPFWIPLISMWE